MTHRCGRGQSGGAACSDSARMRAKRPRLHRLAAVLLLLLALELAPLVVGAESEPTAKPRALNLVECRVLLAMPAALPTGMATGVEATFTRTWSRWLAWGVRISWATATEYSTDYAFGWEVRHDDLRVRGLAVLQRGLGRATLALRLGLGATLVHRGLTQMLLPGQPVSAAGPGLPEETGWKVLPAIELEPAIALRLLGGWGVSLGGGPSLHILDGGARWGWTSGLGVAWQH